MRLEFQNVSYSYAGKEAERKRGKKRDRQAEWGNSPDARWALREVNFAVEPGEF